MGASTRYVLCMTYEKKNIAIFHRRVTVNGWVFPIVRRRTFEFSMGTIHGPTLAITLAWTIGILWTGIFLAKRVVSCKWHFLLYEMNFVVTQHRRTHWSLFSEASFDFYFYPLVISRIFIFCGPGETFSAAFIYWKSPKYLWNHTFKWDFGKYSAPMWNII